MTLRYYQERAIADVLAAWESGARAVCLVAPCGAGKTEMARALLDRAKRPTMTVHTNTLKDQTRRRVPRAWVPSVQSLVHPGAAGDARRAKFARADMVVNDEAHHLGGPADTAWRKLGDIQRAIPRVVGVTATPERSDGSALGDVYDRLVVSVSYSELISNGWLVPCDVDKPSISRVEQQRMKQRPDGVHAYLTSGKRADGTYRPGILFDSTIALCREAVERLNASGVRSALVCLETPADERRRLFDRYALGYLDMLCSPQALAEGFDAARAEVCVLRRSAGHVGFYLQCVGRVLRAYGPEQIADMLALAEHLGLEPDPSTLRPKERALLLDLTDARSIHGLPTADRKYSLEGTPIEEAEPELPEEPESEDEESAGEVEGTTAVEAKYERIRDDLRDRMRELQGLAITRGYRPGYVYAAFREATGIVLPNLVRLSKRRATCKHCKAMAELGVEMLAKRNPHNPGWTFWHPDCWFETLSTTELERRSGEYDYLDEMNPHDWRGQLLQEAAQ